MRKLIAGILPALMVLTPVTAEPTPTVDPEAEPQETEEPAETYAVDIDAEYAALIDSSSGTVLFEKNGSEQADPASLVKIMSVYLAAEKLSPDDTLTMSQTAFQTYNHDQGVLWIQQGETLSVQDCEYAAMLASANDTCAMLAEGTAGSVSAFAEQMNAIADELGLEHTSFDNPFGVYSANQYSSAVDMAMLTKTALKNEQFQNVFGASSYTIQATNMQSQTRMIANDCELLKSGNYQREDVLGAKIGSTGENGYAAAAYAKQGASGLIAVVLQEETADAAYSDIGKMLDYGFDLAQTITITPEDIGTKTVSVMSGKTHVADVVFSADSSFNVLMPKGMDPTELQAEIVVHNEDAADPEHITADVVFTLNGEQLTSSPLNREIRMEPEKEPVNPIHTMQRGFDLICVGVLLLVILRPVVKFIFHHLQPPA